MWQFDTGMLGGEFPYVCVGTGGRPLIVLPGVGDAMFSGRYPPGAGPALSLYFGGFLDRHTVYLMSRPRGLPEGHSIEAMADDHAAMLTDEIGICDVLGFSMGGFVGLALAIRHPELVDRLVLANSGRRIARDALPTVDRYREHARDHDWSSIRADLARAMFADARSVTYPLLVQSVGRFLQPRPAVPSDVLISLDAIGAFDATADLRAVDAQTLVFGGANDPFFPEPILQTTADGIPAADLAVIPRGKHAAFHEFKPSFDRRVNAFLRRARTPASD